MREMEMGMDVDGAGMQRVGSCSSGLG